MLQLAIPIPSLPGRQEIDIEMTVNGQKQKMHFRVELYKWEDCNASRENRIECIQELLHNYGEEWMIYHIDIPTEDYVPLTFVKTKDWQRQRMLMKEVLIDSRSTMDPI